MQLTEQSFGAGFYDLKYVYSANQNNGKILQQLETVSGETTNYTYDSLNRLATASTGAWGQSFIYDGFGNLTDKNVTAGSASTLHMTVNPATNQISTAAYDLNGNLLYFQAGTSYAYDSENRLTAFITATTEGYSYGPDNERIWRRKLDGTQEVYFYGATGERLATYQPGGPTLVEVGRNMYFAGRPVSLAGYQNQYQPYVSADRLGTVRWSGDYQYHTTKFSYYPYGEEYTTTAQEREKFATYYRDGSTGLDYAKNRYYASTYGRFMTADPYGGSADLTNPGSWNRYAYVLGDPVNQNDPSGLETSESFCNVYPNYWLCHSNFYDPMLLFKNGLAFLLGGSAKVDHTVRDVVGVPTALRQAIKDLSTNCKKILPSQQTLLSDATDLKFFDAREGVNGRETVAQIAAGLESYNSSGSIQAIVGNDSAVVLNGPGATISSTVLLGGQFFLDPIRGNNANFSVGQGTVLVHELLHYATQLGDDLFIKTYGIQRQKNESSSSAISRWLQNGCKN